MSADIGQAVNIARNVDYVVLVRGLDQTQEREQFDCDDLVLPRQKENLINSVAKAAKKSVILVILSGGQVDISFAKYNPKIWSILWAGYPGEAGLIALAKIKFGEHNHGGKLPITWYLKKLLKEYLWQTWGWDLIQKQVTPVEHTNSTKVPKFKSLDMVLPT